MTHSLGTDHHTQPDDEVELDLDDAIQSSEGACATEVHATSATITRMAAEATNLRAQLASSASEALRLQHEVAILTQALQIEQAARSSEHNTIEGLRHLAMLEHMAVAIFDAVVLCCALEQCRGSSEWAHYTKKEGELWMSVLAAMARPENACTRVLSGKAKRVKYSTQENSNQGMPLADHIVDLALQALPIEPPIAAAHLMYTMLAWHGLDSLETMPRFDRALGRGIRENYPPNAALARQYHISPSITSSTGSVVTRAVENCISTDKLPKAKEIRTNATTKYTYVPLDENAEQRVEAALNVYGRGACAVHAADILVLILQRNVSLHTVYRSSPDVQLVDWQVISTSPTARSERFLFRCMLGDLPLDSKTHMLVKEYALRKAVYLAEAINSVRRGTAAGMVHTSLGAFASFATKEYFSGMVGNHAVRDTLHSLSQGLVDMTIIQPQSTLGAPLATVFEVELNYQLT